jgi:hypothetical protein
VARGEYVATTCVDNKDKDKEGKLSISFLGYSVDMNHIFPLTL